MSFGEQQDSREPEFPEADPGLDIEVLRRRRERALTFLAISGILAVTLVCAFFWLRPKPLDRRVVIAAAQRAVRDAVGERQAFDFGNPVHVEIQPEGEFLVRGEVVAVTPDLQPHHYWYDCVVHRQSDGSWGPAQLTLLPQ